MPILVGSQEFVRRFELMERKLANVRFVGMSGTSTPDSITIGPPSDGGQESANNQIVSGWFKITGSATRKACYTANPFIPVNTTLDMTSASALTEGNLGSASSDTVYLANMRELGASTHDLASSAFLPLLFFGVRCAFATDGKPIYMIDGFQWEDCS